MRFFRKIYAKVNEVADFLRPMNISLHGAYTTFFLIISVFPLLLLLLGILRYTHYEVSDLVNLLENFIPQSMMSTVEKLITAAYKHSSGTVVSLSVLATLWSASKGTYGLLWGFRGVYDTEHQLPYWKSRGLSLIYTCLILIALVLVLAVHMFGNAVIDYLWMTTTPWIMQVLNIIDLRFWVLLFTLFMLFTVMYALLPGQHWHLRQHIPGALVASAGWSLCSRLFSVYVEYFTDYYNIFGSVYGVALVMLWLYFCICILFYAAAFNRYLVEKKS